MKQQVIDLWKESFGDSDEFIELFFNRVYKEENTLTIRKNNQIISVLQIVPYEMTFWGAKVTAGYICGVCTLPSERGKGWMKQLMQEAIDEMQRRKYILTVLIPASEWLFNYYHKFGYTTIFDKSEEIHTQSDEKNEKIRIVAVTEILFDQAYDYYNRIQQQRECAILHSAYDFETIQKECILDGGNVWIALQNSKITGLALTVPTSNDELYIKDIIYDHPEAKTSIIQSVLDVYQAKSAKVRIPPTPANSEPYGMARIIDKEFLIQHYLSADIHADINAIRHLGDTIFTLTMFQYDQRKAFMNLMLD
ncbi:MAG: GNAT family N-acetyltransferase [Tannerella sp.]|jgi:predicted acetyltransferase|nr:GNAT family N-acetyltransferase [Tannerella sp.]